MLFRSQSLVLVLYDLLLHLLLHFIRELPPQLNLHLDDLQRVSQQLSFDILVDCGINSERRCMVNLQHPWLKFAIKHYVKAEQLEAAVRLFGLATSVDVL